MAEWQNTDLLTEELLEFGESPSSAWASINCADAHDNLAFTTNPKSCVLLAGLGPARTNIESDP